MSASSLSEPAPRPRRHDVYFAVVAVLVMLFMAASSAPSPLFVVYQRMWGFSSGVLTVIFAIYVLGLLAALLVAGRLSDHLGRRPVLLVAIALEAVSMVLFLLAGDVVALCIARLVQGLATGVGISVLGASLVDLVHPERKQQAGAINSIAPTVGLALGALGTGALVQYGPAPTRLVYAVLLAALVVAGLVVAFMPETAARRFGALRSLTPKAHLPASLRTHLMPIIPVLIAGWAVGGLYFSLGPSIAVVGFGLTSHLMGGIVIAVLCGTAAVASFAFRPVAPVKLVIPTAAAVGAGAIMTLIGIHTGLIVFAILGTIIAGAGFGGASVAAFGTVARHAEPQDRSAVIAFVYVVSYLAFSVPAVLAGVASNLFGLKPTAEVYTLIAAVLAATAVALGVRAHRAHRLEQPASV
jgi:MFS family permease